MYLDAAHGNHSTARHSIALSKGRTRWDGVVKCSQTIACSLSTQAVCPHQVGNCKLPQHSSANTRCSRSNLPCYLKMRQKAADSDSWCRCCCCCCWLAHRIHTPAKAQAHTFQTPAALSALCRAAAAQKRGSLTPLLARGLPAAARASKTGLCGRFPRKQGSPSARTPARGSSTCGQHECNVVNRLGGSERVRQSAAPLACFLRAARCRLSFVQRAGTCWHHCLLPPQATSSAAPTAAPATLRARKPSGREGSRGRRYRVSNSKAPTSAAGLHAAACARVLCAAVLLLRWCRVMGAGGGLVCFFAKKKTKTALVDVLPPSLGHFSAAAR